MKTQQSTSQKVSGYHFSFKTFDELSVAELYEVLKLRIGVFVVEQNCPYHECDGHDLQSTHVMMYNPMGSICAYARYYSLSEPGTLHIGRVLVEKNHRMDGLGRMLMERVLTKIKENSGRDKIEIAAQLYLKRFYTDFGFEPVGEPYSDDRILHVKMIKHL